VVFLQQKLKKNPKNELKLTIFVRVN
jgi:hypothetical protein